MDKDRYGAIRVPRKWIAFFRIIGHLTRRNGCLDQAQIGAIHIVAVIVPGERIEMRGQEIGQFRQIAFGQIGFDRNSLVSTVLTISSRMADSMRSNRPKLSCLYSLIGFFCA
jgi:hypothetical protein